MDLDLYNREILDLAASIPRIGELEAPDVSVTARSRLCGSRITVHLKFIDDRVADYAHEVHSCVIGKAVASAVAQNIVDLPVAEIRAGAAALRSLLKAKVLPTSAPWTVLEPFLPVSDLRARHGSALLPFDALERALDEVSDPRCGRDSLAVTFDQAIDT